MTRGNSPSWLLLFARALACLVGALWIFFGIAHSLGKPWDWESTILAVLTVLIVIGVLVSWWQERLGGLILCACGVLCGAFAYVNAEHYKLLGMVLTGGPVLFSGLLFLLFSFRNEK